MRWQGGATVSPAFLIFLLAAGCAELTTTTHQSDHVLQTQRIVTPIRFLYTGAVVAPDLDLLQVHLTRGTDTCAVNYNESYVVYTQTDRSVKGSAAAVELGTGIPLTVVGGVLLGTAGLVDPSVTIGSSDMTDPTGTSNSSGGFSAQTLMYVLGGLSAAGGLVLTTAGIVNYARQDSTTTTSQPRMRTRRGEEIACNVGEAAPYVPVTAMANGVEYPMGATDGKGNLTIKLPDVTSSLCNGQPDSLEVMAHSDVIGRVSIMPYCKNIAEQQFASLTTYEDLTKFAQNFAYSPRINEVRARIARRDQEQAAAEQARQAADARAEREKQKSEQAQQARMDAENRRHAEERRQKESAAKAEREQSYIASCGGSPTIDSWHGIPRAAYNWLKQNLNDDDFDVISCSTPQLADSGCWVDMCKIRGKNSFGAKILTVFKFSIANDKVMRGRELN